MYGITEKRTPSSTSRRGKSERVVGVPKLLPYLLPPAPLASIRHLARRTVFLNENESLSDGALLVFTEKISPIMRSMWLTVTVRHQPSVYIKQVLRDPVCGNGGSSSICNPDPLPRLSHRCSRPTYRIAPTVVGMVPTSQLEC